MILLDEQDGYVVVESARNKFYALPRAVYDQINCEDSLDYFASCATLEKARFLRETLLRECERLGGLDGKKPVWLQVMFKCDHAGAVKSNYTRLSVIERETRLCFSKCFKCFPQKKNDFPAN